MDATKWLAIVGVISALTLGVGFITALISAGLGWKVNREQKVEIARANESAADAKLKADKLESDNLTLRSQVATLETKAANAASETKRIENEGKERIAKVEAESREKIAGLTTETEKHKADIAVAQAQAAKAREKTQETFLRVEEEARKRLEAERALLEAQKELERRQTPVYARGGIEKLRKYLREHLSKKPTSEIEIWFQQGDPEAYNFAGNLKSLLQNAGWKIKLLTPKENLYGFMVYAAKDVAEDELNILRDALVFAFIDDLGAGLGSERNANVPQGTMRVEIGSQLMRPFIKKE